MAVNHHNDVRGPTTNLNNSHDSPLQKDFSRDPIRQPYDDDLTRDNALNQVRTASTINLSPELFEKLYLSPENRVKGDLRKTFANPTPLCLVGFLLSLTPLSCNLMGWRGTGAGAAVGASGTGSYFFFGGLLMVLGAIGEFFLGNTFPFVVFGSFGAFWLTFAATLQPFYNAYGAYSPDPEIPGLGANTAEFRASFAFFLLSMGVLCLLYLVCALRTNVVFCFIFFTLVIAFSCLSGAYWQVANGNLALAGTLQITGGAFTFLTCVAGWYILAAILLASVDFPLQLPVGDLSTLIKPKGTKKVVSAPKHKEHDV